MTTTNSIASSVWPNHSSASGTQHTLGSVCRPEREHADGVFDQAEVRGKQAKRQADHQPERMYPTQQPGQRHPGGARPACRRARRSRDSARRSPARATAPATRFARGQRCRLPEQQARRRKAARSASAFHKAALPAVTLCLQRRGDFAARGRATSRLLMSRGRGRPIANCSRIRPGRGDISITRSARHSRLAHIVRHEDDGLSSFLPDRWISP